MKLYVISWESHKTKIPGIECRGFIVSVFNIFIVFKQFRHYSISIGFALIIAIIFFP
nr:MAG TPA: hypothetical protein [Caudoviricetes sp.]